jgi:hypothetical protein
MKQRKATKSIWSPRSQKSMLRQLELEAAQEKCRNQIAFAEKRIAQQKQVAERQTATVVKGNSYTIRQALNQTLADIEEREREVAAYRVHEETLRVQIDALEHPPFAQRRQRAKLQSALAAEVIERFAIDRAIDALLQKLRKALLERAALTAKIVQTALRLDFTDDDFDGARFAALLDSLPINLESQSLAWVNWFLGQADKREPHTIGNKAAVLAETLASANVWRPGESVFLTKEEAAKLPLDETAKPLPGPVEMETQAGNILAPIEHKPEEADTFPVSGFPVGVL